MNKAHLEHFKEDLFSQLKMFIGGASPEEVFTYKFIVYRPGSFYSKPIRYIETLVELGVLGDVEYTSYPEDSAFGKGSRFLALQHGDSSIPYDGFTALVDFDSLHTEIDSMESMKEVLSKTNIGLSGNKKELIVNEHRISLLDTDNKTLTNYGSLAILLVKNNNDGVFANELIKKIGLDKLTKQQSLDLMKNTTKTLNRKVKDVTGIETLFSRVEDRTFINSEYNPEG